jgi:hypothetical protein
VLAPRPHPLFLALVGKVQTRLRAALPPAQLAQAPAKALETVVTNTPSLTIFAGYLGDQWQDPTNANTQWWPLFFDAAMSKGMLVDKDDIEIFDARTEETAAFGKRDYIWVNVDKPIRVGTGPPAFWLNGSFTRAGDFAASVSGGTIAPQQGILRDATTPTCCGMRSRG